MSNLLIWKIFDSNVPRDLYLEWQSLFEHYGVVSSQTPLWVMESINCFGLSNCKIFFAYDKELLVAVIPLIKIERRIKGVNFRILRNLSHNHQDVFSVLSHEGYADNDIIENLCAWIKESYTNIDVICCRKLFISNHFKFDGCYSIESYNSVAVFEAKNNRLIDLVSKKLQKNILRHKRNLSEFGNVQLQVSRASNIDKNIQSFLDVENSGWKEKEKTSIKSNSKLVEFYKKLVHCWVTEEKGFIFSLALGDEVIASAMAVKFGNTLTLHKIAYDEQWAAHSPGSILIQSIFEYCDTLMIKSISFGTNPKWAERWHPQLKSLIAFDVPTNSMKGLLWKSYLSFKQIMKK